MIDKETSFQIDFLKHAYNNFQLNKGCSFTKTPLLPLSVSAFNVARIYCLNNYEISIIQYRFLFYWIKHSETPYITAKYLLQTLGLQKIEIFQLILDVYEDRIDYNIFFNFFCIMTFSQIDRIIKVILSACGIHSNYGVSKDMAESFFTKISKTAMFNEEIIKFLNNNDELIPMKNLVIFIQFNGELYNPFWQIRLSLVRRFFSHKYFMNILKRITFYDESFSNHTDIPKESCLSSFYRVLVLKEPPPYYTEYRDTNTDPKFYDELFDLYMVERRKKYGYSKRITQSRPHSLASEVISPRNSTINNSNQKSSQKTTVNAKRSIISFNQILPQTTSSD